VVAAGSGGFVVTSPLPAFRFGHPELAVNFTLTPLLVSASLAVPVWLVRAARQLAADRLALAEEAVVRERLRIDGELRRTVGAALETIAATASRADGLADDQLSAAEAELGVLVDRSRRTLAEARRLLSRYREASLQGELETAAALLAAAGIPIHVELPRGELAEGDDEAARVALRRDLARLLHDDAARRLGVTATGRDGWVRLALGTGAGGPAATTGVSA
jgi:two-component system sensor histidine kinase DesK